MESALNSSFEPSMQSLDCESPQDLLSKFSEKIRSQAQRLRRQDQYKTLCEQRILELCPSHPLPILPSHMGWNPSEENLRNELIINEHQRNYIDLIQKELKELQDNKECKENLKTSPKLHNKVIQQEDTIKSLENQLKKAVKEVENLTSEKKNADSNLVKAEEALLLIDIEVSRLEEEKAALIDYVDEHSVIEEQLKADLEKIKDEYLALEKEFEKICTVEEKDEIVNENLRINNTTLTETLKETQAELDNLQKQYHALLVKDRTNSKSQNEMNEHIANLESENQRLTDQILELKENTQNGHIDLFKVREEYENIIQKTQNEFCVVNEKYHELMLKFKEKTNESARDDEVQALQKELSSERCSVSLLKYDTENLKTRVNELNLINTQLEQANLKLKQELEIAKENISNVLFDLKTTKQAEEELRESLEISKEQYISANSELQKQDKELIKYKKAMQKVAEDLKSFKSEKLSEEFSQMLARKHKNVDTILSVSFSEIKTQLKEIEKLNKKVEKLKEDIKTKNIESSSYSQEISGLRQRETVLQGQLEALEKQNKMQKTSSLKSISSLQTKHDSLAQENANLNEKVGLLRKQNSEIQAGQAESQAVIETLNFNLDSSEHKLTLLNNHRQEIENICTKLQSFLPFGLSHSFYDLCKLRKDLEFCEREMLNLNRQMTRLMKRPEENRKAITDVRTNISKCEGMIQAYQTRIRSIEEEISSTSFEKQSEQSTRLNLSLLSQSTF